MSVPEREAEHCFVSPHFDDAVFSCGGAIHQLTAAGRSVTVITAMGGLHQGEMPRSPILDDLHRRWRAGKDPLRTRQNEDVQALRLLQAAPLHLSLTDCVYRCVDGHALYPSEESLFGAVHEADYAPAFLDATPLPDETRELVVWLPLGAGNHVDHQVTRDWGLRLLARKPARWTLRFYAEYPYFAAEGAISQALAALNTPMRQRHTRLDETDMAARLAAMACYQSQISTFWRGLEQMEEATRRACWLADSACFVEPYWEPEPTLLDGCE